MGRPSNKSLILKTRKEHPKWSKEKIALEVGCSLRTVQRHLPLIEEENIVSDDKTNVKTQGKIFIPPQDPIDDNWFEMDDPELSRHTYREVLLSNKSTVRERLEAASKLVDLKYKSGTLDVKTQSEKEVIDKFRQHDTQTLVKLLKESSQKELS